MPTTYSGILLITFWSIKKRKAEEKAVHYAGVSRVKEEPVWWPHCTILFFDLLRLSNEKGKNSYRRSPEKLLTGSCLLTFHCSLVCFLRVYLVAYVSARMFTRQKQICLSFSSTAIASSSHNNRQFFLCLCVCLSLSTPSLCLTHTHTHTHITHTMAFTH